MAVGFIEGMEDTSLLVGKAVGGFNALQKVKFKCYIVSFNEIESFREYYFLASMLLIVCT